MLVLGAAPAWPYSRGWGYGPSGLLGLLFVVLLVLMILGAFPSPWATQTVVVPQ